MAEILLENNRLMVSGDLSFSTVMDIWRKSLPLLSALDVYCFDFSNVISSNSAGLALMIQWVKKARGEGKNISFDYLPSQVVSIAEASGVGGILGLSLAS